MTLPALISKLKNTVLQDHDLNKVWTEFFDLALHPDFMKQSEPSHLKNLGFILEQIGKSIMPGSGALRAAPIMRCRGTDFYHGALKGCDKPGAFIYFDDAGVGMAAFAAHGIQAELCRFSAAVVNSPHCFVPTQSHPPAKH